MATIINGSKHLPTTIDNTHLNRTSADDERKKKPNR